MTESRLQRWARKKAEASKEAELSPSSTAASPSTTEGEPSPEEQELAINEALPEQGVLEKYGLPDPDAIELGTDVTGFMRKEIPELLRRKALRALWRSNPVLAVLDGLNDYDEDFSNAATTVNGVQTLYKVGQGMFDKAAKAHEELEEQAKAPEAITSVRLDDPVAEPEAEKGTEKAAEKSEPAIATESSPTRHGEPEFAEAETEPERRYRPRMRFDG